MSKTTKTSKKETEAALVARRTKEVALAATLSTPEAKERLQENGERAKAKAQAARAAKGAALKVIRNGGSFTQAAEAAQTARLTPGEAGIQAAKAEAANRTSERLVEERLAKRAAKSDAQIAAIHAPAKAKTAKEKAAAPRQRAGEWFFGQEGAEAFGPFTSQMEALEDARKRWPKYSERLTRKLSRFVRIGVWLNTAKTPQGARLKWYATTREGNEGLFKLPKAAAKPAA